MHVRYYYDDDDGVLLTTVAKAVYGLLLLLSLVQGCSAPQNHQPQYSFLRDADGRRMIVLNVSPMMMMMMLTVKVMI